MALTIGIDIGTSSTKAVVTDETGKILFAGGPTYDFDTPKPLWAENDPKKMVGCHTRVFPHDFRKGRWFPNSGNRPYRTNARSRIVGC